MLTVNVAVRNTASSRGLWQGAPSPCGCHAGSLSVSKDGATDMENHVEHVGSCQSLARCSPQSILCSPTAPGRRWTTFVCERTLRL